MNTSLDILSLEIGSGLTPLLADKKANGLLKRIFKLKKQLTDELGFPIPKVKIIENSIIESCEYKIQIKSVEKGKGRIPNDCILCINYGSSSLEFEGEKTKDPVYDDPAIWISKYRKEEAKHIGYTVVEPVEIISKHLEKIVKEYITDIFSINNTKNILDSLRKNYPKIADEVLNFYNGVETTDIYKILQGLLKEDVSIRNIVSILKVISYYAPFSKKTWFLIEKSRQALGKQICSNYTDGNGILHALTIDPIFEKLIIDSKKENSSEISLNMNSSTHTIWNNAVRKVIVEVIKKGWRPVILCSSELVRVLVRESLIHPIPKFGVLSIWEIPSDMIVERVGQIKADQINYLSENKPITGSKEVEEQTIGKFFYNLELLFEKRRKNELKLDTMNNNLLDLLNKYTHLDFCKKIKSYNLKKSELLLFLCFCHLFISKDDNSIGFNDLKVFYEDRISIHIIMSSLSEGNHILVKNKFIECNDFKNGYNSETWKLTEKIKKELFSGNFLRNDHSKINNLILFDSIKNIKMVYNTKENEAVLSLISLLREENFHKIQDRLNAKYMRQGFTCLFSGLPGTGKTETAYQIARETKRNIMKVNISETKSMWLGESEKNIKAIFDSYRKTLENSEIAPILLLNEADAVIGKRIEFNSGSRSIDKTENRIQNIILEEMENFPGILITTSNLIQNMDTAFERRFLYRITFDKPNVESRKSIWHALLPNLPEEIAQKLSKNFDLSGRQIENIARKVEVDSILSGDVFSMDSLIHHCKEENQNSFDSSKKIGFSLDKYEDNLI